MTRPRPQTIKWKPVTVLDAEKLQEHQGHMLVSSTYGNDTQGIVNAALECEDCALVLADWEIAR